MTGIRKGMLAVGVLMGVALWGCGDGGETAADICAGVRCVNGVCDGATGLCVCADGYAGEACDRCADGYLLQQGRCLPPECTGDDGCNDGLSCNGNETCTPGGACRTGTPVVCGDHARCTEPEGVCGCDPGYHDEQGLCRPDECDSDGQCDDADPCNGAEICNSGGQCQAGDAVVCGDNARCDAADGLCHCTEGYVMRDDLCVEVTACPQAFFPGLEIYPLGTILPVGLEGDGTLWVGVSLDTQAEEPPQWREERLITLNALGDVAVFTRSEGVACETVTQRRIIRVEESLPPAAEEPGSTAIAMDDDAIAAWAQQVTAVDFGDDVGEDWTHTENALGPAEGNGLSVVSLGRGGSITLGFTHAVADGPGYDFAVFENAFLDDFIELAFVEVSSDGLHFVRFDTLYLGTEPVGAYGQQSPQLVQGFAGKYRQGFGTPFDLALLARHPDVRSGLVNLSAITHIRIVDVVGDGGATDSFGNPVYDPYPTVDSAGFDLDAVGVMHPSGGP